MKRAISLGCMVAVMLGLATSAGATLTLFTSEADFLAQTSSTTTETFDQYSNVGFQTPSVVVNGVQYATNRCTNRCWTFTGGSFLSNHVGDDTITFGSDRYVDSFGFRLTSGALGPGIPSPLWELLVEEINGSLTYLPVNNPSVGPIALYYGFESSVGIKSVSVLDYPFDTGASQFEFDNVSRSDIRGGQPLVDSVPLPPGTPDITICIPGPCQVSEPSTLATAGVGFVLLLLGRRLRARAAQDRFALVR